MIDGEDKLIQGAVRGESSAFGTLYDHYQPKIYRFVLIKVGQREDAEDLTHQVFVNAWQNVHSYTHRGFPFSSWLYQIARNVVIDHYRTKKPSAPLEEFEEGIFIQAAEFSYKTDIVLDLERVARAIRELRPEYQDVIVMRFIEDLPIREVAAALGKSEGAVKLMQHRAINDLKMLLH